MRHLSMLVLALTALSSPAAAQLRPVPLLPAPTREAASAESLAPALLRAPAREQPTLALVAGGLLGGAVGLFGGAAAGYALETSGGCRDAMFCGLGGAVVGGILGESILLPLGVHLANRGRGSAGTGVMASLGVAALGVFAAASAENASDSYGTLVLLAVPAAQLAVVIPMQRRAERARRDRALGALPGR